MHTSSNVKAYTKWLIGAAAVLLSLGVCFTPWGRAGDRFCYDLFFLLRGPEKPTEDIVVVAIDEPSFGALGYQWPWPRRLHAQLIDALFDEGAKCVALDVIFSETAAPEDDRRLAAVIAGHSGLVLAADVDVVDDAAFTREILVGPHPSLVTPKTAVGMINLPVDPDGFIRWVALNPGHGTAFSLVAARLFTGRDSIVVPPGRVHINYLGPQRTIKTVSYYQALAPRTYLPPNFFKDKLVFLGFSTRNMSELENRRPDHFPTPYTQWRGGYTAGVEIHAQIAHNLLQSRFISRCPQGILLLCGGIIWLVSGFAFFRLRPIMGGGVLVLDWGLILFPAYGLFVYKLVYVPILYLLLPLTVVYLVSPFLHYFQSWKEREFIRRAFSTYVSPSVVRELMRSPERLELGGETRQITALFSDVQGFSGISEQLSPHRLVELLNEFLTEMTDIILHHVGTVDKFEGDAIIAMFGAPNALENHAAAACRASIEMQQRLAVLRQDWRSRGMPALYMRVGLCSGPAVVGNMGSKNRMDYTMMGDTVNIAARLEGVNKVYGTGILVSASTHDMLTDPILSREIDSVRVVGRETPVTIYELPAREEKDADDRLLSAISIYAEGLAAYRERDWHGARAAFEKGLKLLPDDGPSREMIRRCVAYATQPPPEDWQGAYVLDRK